MNKRIRAGFLLAGLCILLAGGFVWNAFQNMDSGTWEPLAGAPDFYTRTDYEGWLILGYSKHWWQQPETLLGGFSNWRRENNHIMGDNAEDNSHVAINASAGSIEEVEASIVIVEIKER